MRIIVSMLSVTISLTIGLVLMQYAHGQPCTYKDINGVCTEVENNYFSINIPDNWTYLEYSHTPESALTGLGTPNGILLTPREFSDMLVSGLSGGFVTYREKILEGGVSARFHQDTDYRIKNIPLESYVKHVIENYGIQNITSQHYTTVGKEKAVRIEANESASYDNSNIVLYVVMHDKQPYEVNYIANPKNYEKYLPEFEQMVKSFRFVGSPSEIENLPENQTNTATNFSGVNLNRPYIGIAGLSLTPDLSKQIGLNQTKGFLLTFITKGSPADNAGLRAGTNTTTINGRDIIVGGDIVLKIDNREVSNIDDIKAYVRQKHPGDNVHLTILRDNTIREPDVILGISPSQDRINSPSNDFSNGLPNTGSKNQEELYNECVNVAGKSLCDFLFKR